MSSPQSEGSLPAGRVRLKRPVWLQHAGIGMILVLFLGLGCVYSVTTPIFETPDEPGHYEFVKRLADGKGLPALAVSEDRWKQGELHQPPLYYAVGALLTGSIDTGPADTLYQRNPYAALGVPQSPGNKNAVLHLAGEEFPYRGVSLAVHLLRWFSVLCSGLTVLLTYAIAVEIVPGRRAVATGAAALVAFNPQFLFISAGCNNDGLVTLFATMALYVAARVCNGKGRPFRTPVVLGASIGLAALTKVSGLAAATMIPCAYATYASSHRPRRLWKDVARPMLIATATALAVGGWWYARNAVVYHNPLGMNTYSAVFRMNAQPLPLKDGLRIAFGSFISYWGVFGWMNILASQLFYALVRILSALGIIGLAVALRRLHWRRRRLGQHRLQVIDKAKDTAEGGPTPAAMLVAVWISVMLVLLVRWSQVITRTQGRLLFPAISGISLFLFLGLTAWIPERLSGPLGVGLAGMLFAFSLIAPFSTIRPAYAPPVPLADEALAKLSARLDATFGGKMQLLGYELDKDRLIPGESIAVTMYWKALAPMRENYSVFVHLLGANDLIIGQLDTYPGQGNYPTSLWSPGEIIADTYVIPVPPATLTPQEVRLEVGLYRLAGGKRLQVADSTGADMGDNVRFGHITLPAQTMEGIPNPLYFDLDGRIAVIGYDLDRTAARPGESFHLTLYWRALRDGDTDYSVFTHVLGERDRIWAQMDGWPQGGNSPTSTWHKGQIIQDPYELVVDASAPMGVYDLEVGMYDATGRRLGVSAQGRRRGKARGYAQDTRVLLNKVRIWGTDH